MNHVFCSSLKKSLDSSTNFRRRQRKNTKEKLSQKCAIHVISQHMRYSLFIVQQLIVIGNWLASELKRMFCTDTFDGLFGIFFRMIYISSCFVFYICWARQIDSLFTNSLALFLLLSVCVYSFCYYTPPYPPHMAEWKRSIDPMCVCIICTPYVLYLNVLREFCIWLCVSLVAFSSFHFKCEHEHTYGHFFAFCSLGLCLFSSFLLYVLCFSSFPYSCNRTIYFDWV